MIDTIFAQATPRGRSAIAVIRVSGPRTFQAVEAMAGRLPGERSASLRWLHDPDNGERIDQGLVLCFPGPRSYTGEDSAELQVHGGASVCRSICDALDRIEGLRAAAPGEFTRRALMNGRLDLAQVEGLGDLLAAETAAQRRQAVRMMEGALSAKAEGWRHGLVRALACIEASIDFPDEDLPDNLLASAEPLLRGVLTEFSSELRGGRMAERLREGFEVALVGAPNAGKSTLLNALAGRGAALISATAGTTRDVIEVRMDLDGLPATLLDMAGLRVGGDAVERLGIALAIQRADNADMRVFLVADPVEATDLGVVRRAGDLVVLSKADLRPASVAPAVSGVTGQGVAELLDAIAAELGTRVVGASSASHGRQIDAIADAAAAVQRAIEHSQPPVSQPEIAAAEVRTALRALDFLIGRVDVEAVLDVIFQSFCLGK